MVLRAKSVLDGKKREKLQLHILSSEATRLAPLDPDDILSGWQ